MCTCEGALGVLFKKASTWRHGFCGQIRKGSAAICHVSIASDQAQAPSRSCKFRSIITHSYSPSLYRPLKWFADIHHHDAGGIFPLIPGSNSASAFLAASTSSAVGSCGTSTMTLGSFEREANIAARFCSMSAQHVQSS